MTITFRCPHCQKTLTAPAEKAGAQVRCPGCQQPLRVPASAAAATQPPVSPRPWYFMLDGQKRGPVSEADLKRLAASGKLKPSDMIWKEGMAKWVPAGSMKGLFPAAQAPAKTLPPPPPAKAAPPVTSGASEIVETVPAPAKAPLRERAMGLFSRVKRLWQPLKTPAKVGIIGGAAAGGLLLLLLFCVLPLWWVFGGSGIGSPSNHPVPVDQIAKEFDKDHEAAQKKYGGKRLTLTGVVDTVDPVGGELFVHMDGEAAIAHFDESYRSKMKKGDTVVFEGTIDDGGDHIHNCRLVEQSGKDDSGSKVDNGSFTAKALEITGGKVHSPHKVKDVRPHTREDFIQALRVLGADVEDITFKGTTPEGEELEARGVGFGCEGDEWVKVFGEPERLPDAVGFIGGDEVVGQRWKHRCVDGPLTFHGNIIDQRSLGGEWRFVPHSLWPY